MPSNGADAVVFSEDNTQALLCKREDFRIWVLPGGGVEDGESLEQAAIRETFEETGYEVAIDRLVGRFWHPQFQRSGIWHVFEAHVIGGKPTKSFETIDLGFFPVKDLPTRTMEWTREQIADAILANSHVVERTQILPPYLAVLLRIGMTLRDLRNKWILKHR